MHRRRLEGGGRRRVKAAAATAEGMEGVVKVAVMVVVAMAARKPEDHNLRSLFRKRRMLGQLKLGFPQ